MSRHDNPGLIPPTRSERISVAAIVRDPTTAEQALASGADRIVIDAFAGTDAAEVTAIVQAIDGTRPLGLWLSPYDQSASNDASHSLPCEAGEGAARRAVGGVAGAGTTLAEPGASSQRSSVPLEAEALDPPTPPPAFQAVPSPASQRREGAAELEPQNAEKPQLLGLIGPWLNDGTIADVRALLDPTALPWTSATPWIAIVPAHDTLDASLADGAVQAGAGGIMIVERDRRLLEAVPLAALDAFVTQCRDRGLTVSLMGRIEPPDVPRLMLLGPSELCIDLGEAVDVAGLFRFKLLCDLAHGEAETPASPISHGEPDRIFMRDWVLPISIGAYASERDAPQRVRFSVEAAIAPRRLPATDLRDVVSYDLITDTIRRLTAEHVDLVETLAEGIAAGVLRHPRVLTVTVTIEKLDLGPGAMGCRIVREKPSPVP